CASSVTLMLPKTPILFAWTVWRGIFGRNAQAESDKPVPSNKETGMSAVNPATTLEAFTTQAKFADEAELLASLAAQAQLDPGQRRAISARAAELVRRIRAEARPTMMEHFLAEYGLSTREGVALMCLAEAMLRVP